MPNSGKDALEEHKAGRLTQSTQYFSIDKIADPDSKLPHTMPSAAQFSDHMRNLRIRKNDQIVCYDH